MGSGCGAGPAGWNAAGVAGLEASGETNTDRTSLGPDRGRLERTAAAVAARCPPAGRAGVDYTHGDSSNSSAQVCGPQAHEVGPWRGRAHTMASRCGGHHFLWGTKSGGEIAIPKQMVSPARKDAYCWIRVTKLAKALLALFDIPFHLDKLPPLRADIFLCRT